MTSPVNPIDRGSLRNYEVSNEQDSCFLSSCEIAKRPRLVDAFP